MPISHPEVRRRDKVAEDLAKRGPEAAMEDLRARPSNDRIEQLADTEALAAGWAKSDPRAAWNYIATKLAPAEDGGSRDRGFWQTAVSGYVEGVAESDPEGAVAATLLLDREEPIIAAGESPALAVEVPAEKPDRPFVWERGWVPPVEPAPEED